MKKVNILFVALMVMSIAFAGCGKKEEEVSSTNPHESGEIPLAQPEVTMAGPAQVSVPDEIKAAWKGIKVEVADIESGKKETLSIDLGSEMPIAGSTLKVKAVSFLPAFQMDGPNVTSRSNELENPAAQVEVFEGDTQIFKGWLFTLYPSTHAFTHPKYSLTLIEGIAAKKG